MAKSMNEIMNELGIKICPVCGKEYTDYPALSRKDNKTEICKQCGIIEAMNAFKNSMKK